MRRACIFFRNNRCLKVPIPEQCLRVFLSHFDSGVTISKRAKMHECNCGARERNFSAMRTLPLLVFALNAQSAFAQFEAHEWGTFTSLVGSNGITQNGMYHEDEPLPPFVHGFGVTQASLAPPPSVDPVLPPSRPCHSKLCFGQDFFAANVITQKMETPVIYFYSDVQRSLDVNVRFPEGLITETFPAPVATSPSMGNVRQAANGNTTFHVDVLPTQIGKIPYVDGSNIYSHARNAASNLVRSGTEVEKFIFYRGIGRFQPRISITSDAGELDVTSPSPADRPLAMFLAHVSEAGQGRLMRLHSIKDRASVDAETIAALADHSGKHPSYDIVSGEGARDMLEVALTASGLHDDEAAAMVSTWENGYLKVPGLRLLYILPRAEIDSVLPLSIRPAPDKLQRVFVGRIEVMLDTEEREILAQVLKERGAFQPDSLGRFAEPKLRRVREVYAAQIGADPALLTLIDSLVQRSEHADENGENGGNLN